MTPLADASWRGQGVVDGHRAGGVVPGQDGGLDAELVEHGPELMNMNMVGPVERPGLGAFGAAVAEEVEGHCAPRRQQGNEPVVDP